MKIYCLLRLNFKIIIILCVDLGHFRTPQTQQITFPRKQNAIKTDIQSEFVTTTWNIGKIKYVRQNFSLPDLHLSRLLFTCSSWGTKAGKVISFPFLFPNFQSCSAGKKIFLMMMWVHKNSWHHWCFFLFCSIRVKYFCNSVIIISISY